MSDPNAEDSYIRWLVISASAVAAVGILTLSIAVTAMVSANFNILEWME